MKKEQDDAEETSNMHSSLSSINEDPSTEKDQKTIIIQDEEISTDETTEFEVDPPIDYKMLYKLSNEKYNELHDDFKEQMKRNIEEFKQNKLSDVKKTINLRDQEIKKLQNDLEMENQKNESLKNELKIYKDQNSSLANIIIEKSSEVNNLKEKLVSFEIERQEFNMNKMKLENEVEEVRVIKLNNKQLIYANEALMTELKTLKIVKDDFEKKIKNSTRNAYNSNYSYGYGYSEVESLKTEIKRLKSESTKKDENLIIRSEEFVHLRNQKEQQEQILKDSLEKLSKDLERYKTQTQTLHQMVKEKDCKIQQLIDTKIENDPKSNNKSMKFQESYNKVTEGLFDLVDILIDQDDEETSDEIHALLLNVIVKKGVDHMKKLNLPMDIENLKELTEEFSCRLLGYLEKKLGDKIKPIDVCDIEDFMSKCVEFILMMADLPTPIVFLDNTKMQFDSTKIDLAECHIRIEKFIRPAISMNGTILARGQAKVKLQ